MHDRQHPRDTQVRTGRREPIEGMIKNRMGGGRSLEDHPQKNLEKISPIHDEHGPGEADSPQHRNTPGNQRR